jgi:PKD repeat protein
MKKIILFAIVCLSALFTTAQCSADFTWSVSGSTVQLTNISTGTNFNSWSFGDGGSSTATSPNHTYSNPGLYDICLYTYYTDSISGFCNDSVCYQITIIDSMGTGCTVGASIYASGNQIIGTNSSMNAGIYNWSVSDYNSGANLANVNTTDLNYSPGYYGDFLVCLTAYDSSGMVCDTLCDLVTLLDTMPNPCNAIADFTWSATGNTVQFTNTSTGTNNNDWSFGDSGNSNATNPNHTYAASGTYTACLYSYYTDSMSLFCGDTVCYLITIQDTMPTGCTVGASIYGSGNQIIGTNSSMNAGIYNWSVSDYNSGANLANVNTTDLNYSPGYYGDFLVCLTAYDSSGMVCDTLCNIITLIDSTGNGCSVSASIYSNVNEIVGINASTGASFFTWTITDYATGAFVNSTTTTDLSYYPNYTGNFWVCLTAHDSSGMVCDTLCDIVTTVFDSLDSTANVAVISFNEFKLYPNPTNAVLNLKFDHLPSNAHARIVDLLGREMVQVDVTSQVTEIQVADFPSGIYIVQLIDANNQITGMHKFVRE